MTESQQREIDTWRNAANIAESVSERLAVEFRRLANMLESSWADSAAPRVTPHPIDTLKAAIEFAERVGPLPRCRHGKAFKDGAGELLEPTCGCRWVEITPESK